MLSLHPSLHSILRKAARVTFLKCHSDLGTTLLKAFQWLPNSIMSSRKLCGIWPLSPLALLWPYWPSGCPLNVLSSKSVPVSWTLNLLSLLPGTLCPPDFHWLAPSHHEGVNLDVTSLERPSPAHPILQFHPPPPFSISFSLAPDILLGICLLFCLCHHHLSTERAESLLVCLTA